MVNEGKTKAFTLNKSPDLLENNKWTTKSKTAAPLYEQPVNTVTQARVTQERMKLVRKRSMADKCTCVEAACIGTLWRWSPDSPLTRGSWYSPPTCWWMELPRRGHQPGILETRQKKKRRKNFLTPLVKCHLSQVSKGSLGLGPEPPASKSFVKLINDANPWTPLHSYESGDMAENVQLSEFLPAHPQTLPRTWY